MNEHTNLLYHGQPWRRTDPGTSAEAGRAIQPSRRSVEIQVEAYALDRPEGFTDYEMGQHFGNQSATYRTRRHELTQAGRIVPTAERRRLPSGRRAVVWTHRQHYKG